MRSCTSIPVVQAIKEDFREGAIDLDKLNDFLERMSSDDYIEMMCAPEIEFLENLLSEASQEEQPNDDCSDQVFIDLENGSRPNFSFAEFLWDSEDCDNDEDCDEINADE